jgi:predicted Co/Zn/Cd cation transporter (cation efflux family)
MAALGIGFAILTSSDAVLLDGLFSLVGCVVGSVSLHVATLVMRPDDDVFHFGYAAYEPMLNLTKGLLMAFITLFALVSAIDVAVHGGREVQAGWASIYAAIAAIGCFAIAVTQWVLASKTKSPLLAVDWKNWLVDGLLSIAVAVAFIIAFLLTGTRYAHLLPYADPAVVIVLVLLSLPIPVKIIRDNWNQLVGRAPDRQFQGRAREAVASALSDASVIETKIRMQQIGRFTYVQLYVICGGELDGGLEEFDQCRSAVSEALAGEFDRLALDVVFTRDPHWVAVSVGNAGLTGKAVQEEADTLGSVVGRETDDTSDDSSADAPHN